MKSKLTHSLSQRNLGISLTAGVLALAPLLYAGAAQAAPPEHAPAYGYYENRNRYPNENELLGVITRERGNNSFEIRGDDGRTYRVELRDANQSRRFRVGDRVAFQGYTDRNVFIAHSGRIVASNYGSPGYGYPGNNYPGSGYPDGYSDRERITLTGVVRNDFRGDQFELRTDQGRTHLVNVEPGQKPRNLERNTRVRVFGSLRGNIFYASNVRVLEPGSIFGEYGDTYGVRSVNFPGTVTAVRSNTRLVVRGDNGQSYEVTTRSRFASSLRQGDRVRVIGQANGFVVTGADVVVLNDGYYRNDDYYGDDDYYRDDNYNREVNFTGTVESTAITSFRIRGDNGQSYEVHYRASLLLRRDQRVRVIGTYDGRVIKAESVDNL